MSPPRTQRGTRRTVARVARHTAQPAAAANSVVVQREPHSVRAQVIRLLAAQIDALGNDPAAPRQRPFAEMVLNQTIARLDHSAGIYMVDDLEPVVDSEFRASDAFALMARQLGLDVDAARGARAEDLPFVGRWVPSSDDGSPSIAAFPTSGVLAMTHYASQSIILMHGWDAQTYTDAYAGEVSPIRQAARRIVHEVNHLANGPIAGSDAEHRWFLAEWRAYMVEQMTLPDDESRQVLATDGFNTFRFRNRTLQRFVFNGVLDGSSPRDHEPYARLRLAYYNDQAFRTRINHLLYASWSDFVHGLGGGLHNGAPSDTTTQFSISSYAPPDTSGRLLE